MGDIPVGGEDDKSANSSISSGATDVHKSKLEHLLMEDGHTAKRSTCPLCKIGIELWIECL
jgi:hypothetical protein